MIACSVPRLSLVWTKWTEMGRWRIISVIETSRFGYQYFTACLGAATYTSDAVAYARHPVPCGWLRWQRLLSRRIRQRRIRLHDLHLRWPCQVCCPSWIRIIIIDCSEPPRAGNVSNALQLIYHDSAHNIIIIIYMQTIPTQTPNPSLPL